MPYPPSGGCSLRNFNLIKEASRHHEIHLLTFFQKAHFQNPSDYKGELNRSIEEMKKYCRHVEVFEIPTDGRAVAWYSLLLFNLLSKTPYSSWKFHSRELVDAVRRSASEQSFDLVEIGTIGLAKYRELVPKLPSLLVHHNIESELLLRRSKSASNPLSRAYLAHQGHKLRRFEQKACEDFDYHTTVSEHDAASLRDIRRDVPVQVVPNGVDTDYFVPGNEPVTENSLIFIGGMTWYPNLDAMNFFTHDVWHLIKSKIPDLTMTMIGRNPTRNIKAFMRKESGFKSPGFVADVRAHLRKAAVYVVPIRVGGGTRLKILDAMAMGKAIVSTSIGCEGIDVTDGVDIVIADTADDIAAKTVELLGNREMREEIGRNAKQKAVDVYSWKKVYPKLDRVYSELAAMRSSK